MAWMRSGYKIKPSQPNYQSFGSKKAEPVTSKAELEQLRRGLGPAQGLAELPGPWAVTVLRPPVHPCSPGQRTGSVQ